MANIYIYIYISVPKAEAYPIDYSDHICPENDFMIRLLIHLSITIVLFLIFHVIKFHIKRCILSKIILPSTTTEDARPINIYIELNNGKDRLMLYLCSLKANIADLVFQNVPKIQELKVDRKCFYSIVSIIWKQKIQFMYRDVHIDLPNTLYIPFCDKKLVMKMIDKRCVLRLLIEDGMIFTEILMYTYI